MMDLHFGDNRQLLPTLPENSVDSMVTDPPYGLTTYTEATVRDALAHWLRGDPYAPPQRGGMMGKKWDAWIPGPETWRACYRALKPGGHMVVFAGARTVDLMGISLRLAGFDVRTTLSWIRGAGFPKGKDIGKALDKAAGRERPVLGIDPSINIYEDGKNHKFYLEDEGNPAYGKKVITGPASSESEAWEGWRSLLKPCQEPILLVRKPFKGSLTKNIQRYGVGALNIDACRVGTSGARNNGRAADADYGGRHIYGAYGASARVDYQMGRYPPDVLFTHAEGCTEQADGSVHCVDHCPVTTLITQSGAVGARGVARGPSQSTKNTFGAFSKRSEVFHDDEGDADRFYPQFLYETPEDDLTPFLYCAAASRTEKEAGCQDIPARPQKAGSKAKPVHNDHISVKPVKLLRWLCKLITPAGGLIVDPFAGTASTGLAAHAEGFSFLGMEGESRSVQIGRARMAHWCSR